jgi:hypothetical protein
MQKIIRFDSNLDKKIYVNFFCVNWCINGIIWRKTLNFKIHINDINDVITRKYMFLHKITCNRMIKPNIILKF